MSQIDITIPKPVAMALYDYVGYDKIVEQAKTDNTYATMDKVLKLVYQAYLPAIARIHLALTMKHIKLDFANLTLEISHSGVFEDGCLTGRVLKQGICIHMDADKSSETAFDEVICFSECCYTDVNYRKDNRFGGPVSLDAHRLSFSKDERFGKYPIAPQMVEQMAQYFETDGFEFINRYFHRSNPVSAQPTTTWTPA